MTASVDGQEQALAEIIPDMQPGDRVVIHEADCEGGDCECDPLVVYGPSGKA